MAPHGHGGSSGGGGHNYHHHGGTNYNSSLYSNNSISHTRRSFLNDSSYSRNPFRGLCGPCICVLICLIVACSYLHGAANPNAHIMNGFHSATGIVTFSSWHDHSSNYDDFDDINDGHNSQYPAPGSGNFVVKIKYHYGSTANVTYIKGQSYYHFIGGHSCRLYHTLSDKEEAIAFVKTHGQKGQQNTIYYKPPNYGNCEYLDDMVYLYYVSLSMFVVFGVGIIILGGLSYQIIVRSSKGSHVTASPASSTITSQLMRYSVLPVVSVAHSSPTDLEAPSIQVSGEGHAEAPQPYPGYPLYLTQTESPSTHSVLNPLHNNAIPTATAVTHEQAPQPYPGYPLYLAQTESPSTHSVLNPLHNNAIPTATAATHVDTYTQLLTDTPSSSLLHTPNSYCLPTLKPSSRSIASSPPFSDDEQSRTSTCTPTCTSTTSDPRAKKPLSAAVLGDHSDIELSIPLNISTVDSRVESTSNVQTLEGSNLNSSSAAISEVNTSSATSGIASVVEANKGLQVESSSPHPPAYFTPTRITHVTSLNSFEAENSPTPKDYTASTDIATPAQYFLSVPAATVAVTAPLTNSIPMSASTAPPANTAMPADTGTAASTAPLSNSSDMLTTNAASASTVAPVFASTATINTKTSTSTSTSTSTRSLYGNVAAVLGELDQHIMKGTSPLKSSTPLRRHSP